MGAFMAPLLGTERNSGMKALVQLTLAVLLFATSPLALAAPPSPASLNISPSDFGSEQSAVKAHFHNVHTASEDNVIFGLPGLLVGSDLILAKSSAAAVAWQQ